MKVSPEYFIQGKHTAQRKGKFESPGEKGQEGYESPSEKGQGNIVNPGQKTGLIFSYVY